MMYRITCKCGATATSITPKDSSTPAKDISLCHCTSCRRATGLLCASYYPIEQPTLPGTLASFSSGTSQTRPRRYFCKICGCHVFRSKVTSEGEAEWEVASGVVVEENSGRQLDAFHGVKHLNVDDTIDGGLASWFSKHGDLGLTGDEHYYTAETCTSAAIKEHDQLDGDCLCGKIKLHITRPNQASRLPSRPYADLLHPYCLTDQSILKNPQDEKWWLRSNDTKYLAGTCACQSCRLTSGFEIQTWAFVPRANIFFHCQDHTDKSYQMPLEFAELPQDLLSSYESSPGVVREFCGTCGATVFWHEKEDPAVIDVSVGLLQAEEGARAENWLDWWTDRVSFAEDVETGRIGCTADVAKRMIGTLGGGIKA